MSVGTNNSRWSVYMLREQTGRQSALISYLSQDWSECQLNLVLFNYPDLPQVCQDIAKLPVGTRLMVIILGENDIRDLGQDIRDQINKVFAGAVFLYPSTQAAQIETSKIFCRTLLSDPEVNLGRDYNPKYWILTNGSGDSLTDFLQEMNLVDRVIKCDGLAKGKGVWVGGQHFQDNQKGLELIKRVSEEGNVLIEEKLVGQEFSVHTLCYKGRITHSPCVRDFKRRFSGDTGPNTGGMGTVSYADGLMPFLTAEEYTECCQLNERVAAKLGFTGVLYGSFMKLCDSSKEDLTQTDKIKVIEYNCRAGDSELINLLMLLNPSTSPFVEPSFAAMASLCTYVVDKDYAIGNQNSMTEKIISVDAVGCLARSGFFPAGINPINANVYPDNYKIAECRINSLCSVKRHKFNYTRPGRLMAVGATGTDIDELIDIHAGLCQRVSGTDLDWRRDIPEFLRPLEPTPVSSVSTTPRFSHPSITFIDEPTTQKSGEGYLQHLDNYNSIMDVVKTRIDSVNKEIAARASGQIRLTGEIGDFANSIGYFGTGLLDGERRLNGMTLMCSVDGAGTKTKFMEGHHRRFQVLGSDVITHNINDMLCNGGTPVAFLDYYGCDRLDPREFSEYIHGILDVCQSEGIPLIGGETAEMRGIYQPGECEVLGILLGVALNGTRNGDGGRQLNIGNNSIEAKKQINIGNGTLIYGIRSHGAHTNGFTKLREIRNTTPGGMPDWVWEYFCQPHRNYRPVFEALYRVGITPLAKAHITGGGFIDNLMRVVAPEFQKILKPILDQWELNCEWDWVYQNSGMSWSEFTRVFNAGFGMCFMLNEPINRDALPDELAAEIQLLGVFMD